MYKIVDGNKACSEVAYLFSEICSIYPITPSSPMAANIDNLVAKKKNLFNEEVSVIEMQSEAGAAGCMHGALISGSLASTFTASQGLLLMIPNMYKIAGEMLPGVMHVAARSLATHALSIFGDHQDIYAARATGFCMLASTNVYDAQNLAAVAHLAAIEGSLPFLHFFDGFRTSHEINKIKGIEDEKLLSLVNFAKVQEFKDRMLKVGSKKQMGMAENEDIYFQSVEARNEVYNQMPDIVNEYMSKINAIMGTNYQPFNYYGSADAVNVIVAMGSVCDTVKLVIDDLRKKGEKVGLIEVHLYRPFSVKYLENVLPATVKNIAVLDRTKEAGSMGEPLYLDVVAALNGKGLNIVGGRYGLSSKNTTVSDIYSVCMMLKGELKNNFTIGIVDDVTNLSLPIYDYALDIGAKEVLIYGFGSDGMVSTSKDLMSIIGSKDKFVQGYFQYDSKKSGGVTVSNLRVSDKEINAPYYVTRPDMVVITKDEYLFKYEMLKGIKENSIVLINTVKDMTEINDYLPNNFKEIVKSKNLKLLIINAEDIALNCGIKGKISKIMEVVILKLLGIDGALEIVEKSIKDKFATKGDEIVNANLQAITMALDSVKDVSGIIDYDVVTKQEENDVIALINKREGDTLKVSDLVKYRSGEFPCGLSKYEKRNVSNLVPKWNSEACIQCGMCAIVCPHAVIRPFAVNDKEKGIPLLGNKEYNYLICVSEEDCTSCGLCINTCPGKGGVKALSFGEKDSACQTEADYYFNEYVNPQVMDKFTIKGSQFCKPQFEFSGACAGCGETPYIKLLTQLFGEKLVIANATGCSSIYGGSAPSTPYSIPWANSLFEDNAEFAFGMVNSYKKAHERVRKIMLESMDSVNDKVKSLYQEWLDNSDNFEITSKVKEELKNEEIPNDLHSLIDYVPSSSVWAIGGDGWAYDIGFGGIDHVLSSNEDINILVLDTEVYSNTGGQSSKASRIGQVAEFANYGKKTSKKDLFRIAMSYPNCYVASVSLGSNMFQTIKAFKEAEAHKGPSIIIAYSPCIEHGIKGGMSRSIEEEKLAVDVGYTMLMRYNPETEQLAIDSREPDFTRYDEFLSNEVRYNALKIKNKEKALEVLEVNKENAIKRYNFYKNLVTEKKN